uniref:tRNA pseudouridine synthase n=1 Tax=Cyprinodon variegatus TaxID=28743 RepID=A0A3Q2FUH3_CYPVA
TMQNLALFAVLRPNNAVSLSVSSRTDTGVHALSNSAHFDLVRKNDKPPFTEDVLVQALNFHLKAEDIRVTHAHRVPQDFHARFKARSRTYVYRIALGVSHHTLLPLTDWNLCWSLRNTVKVLLTSLPHFLSFKAVVKSLATFQTPLSAFIFRNKSKLPFWELTFRSRSFLYKQVRRMTGALVAVGRGQLSVSQVKQILDARDTLAYPQGVVAPAHGLFLRSVDYKESGEWQSSLTFTNI